MLFIIIGCQPERATCLLVANPARGLLNREKKAKKRNRKSGSTPHAAHTAK